MYDKQETVKNKDFVSLHPKYQDSMGELTKTPFTQLQKDEIFIDFWPSFLEDFLCLIQIFPLKELMDKVEQSIIISALNKYNGNQKNTAKFLNVKPSTLCEKLKKHNISIKKIPCKD